MNTTAHRLPLEIGVGGSRIVDANGREFAVATKADPALRWNAADRAALIVEAVNSHARLLAENQRLTRLVDDMAEGHAAVAYRAQDHREDAERLLAEREELVGALKVAADALHKADLLREGMAADAVLSRLGGGA